MALSTAEILKIFNSVYPVSGEYAFEGERLGIAAILRAIAEQNTYPGIEVGETDEVVRIDDILKIVDQLEQF
jgi:hypothetical protein